MLIEYDIVKFCSIECKLQMSGELSVGNMVDGFIYAIENSVLRHEFTDHPLGIKVPTVSDVLNLGKLIEPNVNYDGFRKCRVWVGYSEKLDWQEVPRQMVNLMEALREPPVKYKEKGISIPVLTPDTFFKNYEEIHPFQDGNGRTGVILFNWLNGTLNHPIWAPDYWGDPRRTIGFGAS